MRILHIVPTYLPAYRYGGPIWSVHALNKWLVKKGVEVTVYTTNVDGPKNLNVPLSQPVKLDGVEIFYFPSKFLRWWFYSPQMRRAIAYNVKDFDLIHITSVFLSASAVGSYYALKFGKPYIISPRGSLMIEPMEKERFKKSIYLSLIERRNLARAAGIHFTTDMEKEEYEKLNLPVKKAIVIPNGLDFRELDVEVESGFFRKKFGIPEGKKIILFLSRLSWKKGLDTLIPAFALVKQNNLDAVLVIAGGDDEGYKSIVEQSMRDNNLKEGSDVVFTGFIAGKDKAAAYKESCVFVLPSYAENFAGVIAEALYLGRPTVMTNRIGTAVLFDETKAALVVNKNDKDVAGAILKIISNDKLARSMGERGKRLVRELYDWSRVVDRFIEAYRTLL